MNTIRFSKRPDKKAPRLTFYLVSPVPVIINPVLLREEDWFVWSPLDYVFEMKGRNKNKEDTESLCETSFSL